MDTVLLELIDKETELKEYSTSNPILKPKLPYLLTWWIKIRLSD